MRSLDDLRVLIKIYKDSGYIPSIKALENIEAQFLLDVGLFKRSCAIAMEARSPDVLEALEPE